MKGLTGRVAIVTGGGRGFGRAIATRLAAEGAVVCVTSRTTVELEETQALIKEAGGDAIAVTGDVTIKADVEHVVKETVKRYGPVSLLVNNAGIPGPFGPLGSVDPDEWWTAQKVHIRAPMLFISTVLPGMIEKCKGTVINVSATGGKRVAPNLSAYCLGKAAQIRMTELLASEVSQHGISIFAIDPGLANTGMAEATVNSPDAQRWLPDMVQRLQERKNLPDVDADLVRCGQRCVDLASGHFDELSGMYIELDDDLEDMLLEVEANDITILPVDN